MESQFSVFGYLKSIIVSLRSVNIILIAAFVYLLYHIQLMVYNLFWHPLARFPGPFLCRASWIQQCYYEAVLNGKLLERLPDYHRKYGPVVRINPNQVHIDDPAVFHEIYKQNSIFTKDPIQYQLGVSRALAFTFSITEHKAKRQALESLFSKTRIIKWEDHLYKELDLLFKRIRDYEERGEEVPIQELYYCYTGDVTSRFLLGKSLDLISALDFVKRVDQLRDFSRGVWVAIHFQIIWKTFASLPRWLAVGLNNTLSKILAYCEEASKKAIVQFNDKNLSTESENDTLFTRLLRDNARRRETQKDLRPTDYHDLADEGTALLSAGTEPTATMMAYATYFFLRYPEVQAKVLQDIETLEPDPSGRIPLRDIESLTYFTGFIRETLRFVPLVPGRLPRVVPIGGLYVPSIQDTIPEGSVVGISHLSIHRDPKIFSQPLEFDPARWAGEQGKRLNHWLLSFSKGRTDCIGKTLAYAEMHLVLANLFRRYHLEIVPGTHESMEWLDRVVVHPKRNLHIIVKTKRKRA